MHTNRVDPTSMESKKGNLQNLSSANVTTNAGTANETISKHPQPQNPNPENLRFLQYGLKIPTHQHIPPNQIPYQPINSPLHLHPNQQIQYRHLQPPAQTNVNLLQNVPQRYGTSNHPPQKIQQSPTVHQTTQPPAAPGCNQPITQNTPQIWVPYQAPPIHYQQKQIQNVETQRPSTSTKVVLQSKPKDGLERKKSGGNGSHIRPPSAKRPLEAPVTMQGWLHKQGSEGLMLWKKRWFVLSEFCLFYYKGMEEDKLLGSILLPSYKVSVCLPEEKVGKKYAFKCEHANMRTYILAADSLESMVQWVRVLNLASFMQTPESERPPATSEKAAKSNNPIEKSESTTDQQQSMQNLKMLNIETQIQSPNSSLDQTCQIYQEQSSNQPLYANAPPKPRRLNDGFSSPSPDMLERYNPQYIEHTYTTRAVAKSPSLYGQSQQPEYYHYHISKNVRECTFVPTGEVYHYHTTERRTPDTYGRSKLHPGEVPHQFPTDYEDVYDEQRYKRPMSPIAYAHIVKKNHPPINPTYRPYTPVDLLGPAKSPQFIVPQAGKMPVSNITRPHSADFLEYEVNHRQSNKLATRQQPRPKSSLDINRNTNDNDNYFYSEEQYANKMRNSVQYLQRMSTRTPIPSSEVINTKTAPIRRYQENDTTFPLMRSNTQPLHFNTLHIAEPTENLPIRSRSVLSEGSLSKEIDMEMDFSPDCSIREMYNQNLKNREYDQFTRSASARLTQGTPQPTPMDERHMARDGDRKREESMKRLLEWKQRMLQSPLNRKIQGNRIIIGKPDQYHNIRTEGGYAMPQPRLSQYDMHLCERQSRSNIPQHTSYSSDDEEIKERSKEIVQSQAGRTLDKFPSKTKSPTPAQTISTTIISTFKESVKPVAPSTHLHLALAFAPECENNSKADDKSEQQSTFSEPLKEFNRDSSHLAQVSSLRSEYLNKFETGSIEGEINTGVAVKKMLAGFERKSDDQFQKESSISDEKFIDESVQIEENYMPMTPKKSVLASPTINDADMLKSESDENHYVEMTQNAGASSLLGASSDFFNEHQPYEMVSYNDGKIEPVYMELKGPKKEAIRNNPVLPDILMPSPKRNDTLSTKSDSSDADDEASKDLNSLDTPTQPRFSLSDNFRPASYYLGASRATQEFPDSSDSELVSPPPIPPYPPPPLSVGYTEEFAFNFSANDKKEQLKTFNKSPDQFFAKTLLKKTNTIDGSDRGSSSPVSTSKQLFLTDSQQSSEKSKFGQNSDSDMEIKIDKPIDCDSLIKERAASEEFCNELISLGHNNPDDSKYLDDFHISSVSLISNDDTSMDVTNTTDSTYYEYENLILRSYKDDSNNSYTSKGLEFSLGVLEKDLSESNSMSRTFTESDVFPEIRSDSCNSVSADISSIVPNSMRSTPVADFGYSGNNQDVSINMYLSDRNDFCLNSAPYYYSDLSINTLKNDDSISTLNNQRDATNGNKKDITRIMNPIRCNIQTSNALTSPFKLAAEARSASVDFINLTDKSGSIDEKNIYESNIIKWQKTTGSFQSTSELKTRNILLTRCDKFAIKEVISNDTGVRRSQSLEGLLENVLCHSIDTSSEITANHQGNSSENQNVPSTLEGSYLWEEDSVWRERLRSASHRHTKSMEHLDLIGEDRHKKKKSSRGITREVTYVNDNFIKLEKHQKDFENEKTLKGDMVLRKEGNFIIDREKLRQWDLMSSAPSDDQLSTNTAIQTQEGSNMVVELGGGSCDPLEITENRDAASGSISIKPRDVPKINTRDNTFPRVIQAKKMRTPNLQMEPHSLSGSYRSMDKEQYGNRTPHAIYMNRTPSHPDFDSEARKEIWQINDKMNVSAGDLLGRTHEELVLLLIQLRRRSAQTLQAIENCYNEIDTIQAQLQGKVDQARRMENLQKLDQIKKHLIELEKQYEKGKPLVNLVDNMVKLGSLYRVPTERVNYPPNLRDRLQFNQQIQERRLLSEEKRDWERVNPDHLHLQDKVQQLYQLDRLIHDESKQLQNLQQDKEDIEQALGGLRRRLNKGLNDPAEIEHARQQQIILENELSRVHLMLAQNSKKLEETVAGNARLEQELLVLKQKLQSTNQQRNSQQYSNPGDSLTCTVDNSVTLESDLQRVQKKIGDLQKQRLELSIQVKQLTDKSSNLSLQKLPSLQNNQFNKKKIPSLWRETDLDTMNIVDHGESLENFSSVSSSTTIPLYINTDIKPLGESSFYNNRSLRSNDSNSDNTSINSNLPQEKQEIKTVRIIKRESERRQRDREKSSTTAGRSEILIEEDDSSQCSSILFRPTPLQKVQSATVISPANYKEQKGNNLIANNSVSSPNLAQCCERDTTSSTDVSTDKSPELSPVFQSEAAKQIITEMSDQEVPRQYNRRIIPKEKRRHYTAPNNHLMKSLHQLPTESNAFDAMLLNTRRARDDLDMERALRQRIDAPDVVRSTLSNKELKYNENTIDNILGTPNKINIPERYIPEQLPQLSAEEQEYRLRKVESIKKMLSDTAIISTSSTNLNADDKEAEDTSNSIMNKATSKIIEEKKQREHLLQLNQILAKQVMEMSKIVAVKALAKLPLQKHQMSTEEEDSSPLTPLPIYQQRDNYYS